LNLVKHLWKNVCVIGDINLKIIFVPVYFKIICFHRFFFSFFLETPALFPSPKKLFSLVNLATLGVHTLLYGSEIDACTKDSILVDEDFNKTQKKKRTFVEIKVVYAENMLDLNTTT
jgi:hypothetical protein